MKNDIPAEKQIFSDWYGPEMVPDRLLEDGEIIDGRPGVTLKVIHLPGHTLGSVGFLWEEQNILFSGDAVSGLHSGDGNLPIIYDLQAYKKSVRLLQEMSIRSLYCSHRYRGIDLAPASMREGSEVNQFLQDSLEIAERLDEAIVRVFPYRHKKTFPQLVDDVIAQLPKKFNMLPMAQLSRPFLSVQCVYFQLY